MKRFFYYALSAVLCLLSAGRADALSTANFLKINPSPLSISMGSVASPFFLPNAAFLNPAGTAKTSGYTLWASHAEWVYDMAMELMTFSVPLKSAGCAGMGFRVFNYGVIDIREADSDKVSDIITPKDVQVLVNYSRKIGPLYAGVNAGYTVLELYNQTLNNLTFDAGALYRIDSPDITIGAALKNLGLNHNFQSGRSSRQPAAVTCGAMVGFMNGDARGGAEVGYDFDGRLKGGLGLEAKIKNRLFPRVGYKIGPGAALDNLTFGAGFSLDFPWPLKIEYAYETLGGIGSVHRFGVETVFYAKAAKKETKKKTRSVEKGEDDEEEEE